MISSREVEYQVTMTGIDNGPKERNVLSIKLCCPVNRQNVNRNILSMKKVASDWFSKYCSNRIQQKKTDIKHKDCQSTDCKYISLNKMFK